MARKRSKAALRKRIKPASRWGGHLLLGLLIVALLSAAGMASQLLAASPSPAPPDSTATVSAASQAANVVSASSAAGASSSTRTLYVYGNQLRPLVEETNGVQTLNIYGPGGQIIAQVVRDGQGGQEVRYLLADHLGSTRVVLDGEGNPVARFEYGPHGETTASGTAADEVRYRYTGHPYDEAQGVYETPARGYDPTLGRFLSVDPQRADASPYLYAGNNPVGYVDPAGDVRYPFFVVADQQAQNFLLPYIERILELFGRPPSGTDRGITTYSDLARIASYRDPIAAQPDVDRVITGGVPGIERSDESYILINSLTTAADIHSIAEGMYYLRQYTRESGEARRFGDIIILSSPNARNEAERLLSALSERNIPRIRLYEQIFDTNRPAPGAPLDPVGAIIVQQRVRRHGLPDHWELVRISRAEYMHRMGLEPQRPGENQGGVFRALEPQMDTQLPGFEPFPTDDTVANHTVPQLLNPPRDTRPLMVPDVNEARLPRLEELSFEP